MCPGRRRRWWACPSPSSRSAKGWVELLQQRGQRRIQLESIGGGVGEEESALSNSASSLDSSAASRLFSISSCLFLSLSLSVSCSIAKTGRQFSIAKQRRKSGKVERYSDLVMVRKELESEEIVIAVIGDQGNQDQQTACRQSADALAIEPAVARWPAFGRIRASS